MNFVIKNELESGEHSKILEFLSTLNYYCIEQHPDWRSLGFDDLKNEKNYFIAYDNQKEISCYANIIISRKGPFKTASISFGPAFNNFDDLTEAIFFLYDYFHKKRFIYFSIQLGIEISNNTELLEYLLNKKLKIKYFFRTEDTWSSLIVNLTRDEQEIFQSFSRGHRSDIKKAQKKGLRISWLENKEDLNKVINLYIKMHTHRKIKADYNRIENEIVNIYDLICNKRLGFFMLIYDEQDLVGFLIIFYQGNSARIFKGAADPDRRDIPITHFGIFEVIKKCKQKGFKILDLWGYNHFVEEGDQVYFLNRFKNGFGGEFIFFPKKMNFIMKPNLFRIYTLLKKLREKYIKK